jgi:hypothetical protein
MQLKQTNNNRTVAFDNNVKLIHKNEGKNQGLLMEKNKSYFFQKWNVQNGSIRNIRNMRRR